MSQEILLSLALVFSLIAPERALAGSDAPGISEGWAWSRIKDGLPADLNEHCQKTLDPNDPTGWDDPCRQISAQFLINVLTVRQNEVPRQGVRLDGARVTEAIDLRNAEVGSQVSLDKSQITGVLDISNAHFKRAFSLDGTALAGKLRADGMVAESNISMQGGYFAGDVSLNEAKVGAYLDMSKAHFDNPMLLREAKVDGDLIMQGAFFANNVHLDGAQVGAYLDMREAHFDNDVFLAEATVASYLDLRWTCFKKDLNANALDVHNDLRMDNGHFTGEVWLDGAKVGGNLFMKEGAFFGNVVHLVEAKVGNQVTMSNAVFSKALRADGLDVHNHLSIENASFAGEARLVGAKVGWLRLSSVTASSIDLSDLSGATGSELTLSDIHWRCYKKQPRTDDPITSAPGTGRFWPLGDSSWKEEKSCDPPQDLPPGLTLRNAHIEAFQDDGRSWPLNLDLEGLRYERLGGINSEQLEDMRKRSPDEWIDWLARNQPFSMQPYTQLSAALAAAGRRDTSEAILFAGRERERAGLFWSPSWVWLSLFSYVAGYGIGLYTFRVLLWVVIFTALGATLLKFSPGAKDKDLVWRLGASLHRLLPVIQLNKEFQDFFDNAGGPDKSRKLTRRQNALFSALALVGWVLAAFLIAAIGNLTPK